VTVAGAIALFTTMLAIATVPGPGQVAVVARTSASGLAHGFATAIGIVLGDYLLIALAVFGLSALAQAWQGVFALVGIFGGVYLIWLGGRTLRVRPQRLEVEPVSAESWAADVVAGFVVTLGDPKAVVFYVSFLPAFISFDPVSVRGVLVVMALSTVIVIAVAMTYATLADRARAIFAGKRGGRAMDVAAATAMFGVGLFMLARPLLG
jgi:threonine/homoserine/homoserine lactone efflux protein